MHMRPLSLSQALPAGPADGAQGLPGDRVGAAHVCHLLRQNYTESVSG